jgi:hypothetical protein
MSCDGRIRTERCAARSCSPHFWAIQTLLVLLSFSYCAIHEFIGVLGAEKVRPMFGPLLKP